MPTQYGMILPVEANRQMSATILTIAGAMFLIPLAILVITAGVTAGDIPSPMLVVGGWTMAFGVIVGAVGIFLGMNGE